MGARKELSITERSLVIKLRKEGLTYQAIAGISIIFRFSQLFLDQIGISKTTALKTWKKYQERGHLESLHRTGRPKTISPRDQSIIIREAFKNPHDSASSIKNVFNGHMSKNISRQTIQRILFKKGLRSYMATRKPLITVNQARKRKCFAKEHMHYPQEFWDRVVFSDECTIQINPGLAMQRVRRFQQSNPFDPRYIRPTVKYPTSVMIWGCISSKGYGRLHICEGNMNGEKYIKVLQDRLMPTIEESGIDNPIFQQDSAPCHTCRSVKTFLSGKDLEILSWPGYSPDLNPIENIWSELKKRVARKISRNKSQLIENIIRVWNHELPKDLPGKLISSMPKRIKSVIKNKGYQTKY